MPERHRFIRRKDRKDGTPAAATPSQPIDAGVVTPHARTIEHGLSDVRRMLGDLSSDVLPEGKPVVGLSLEAFQSPIFRAAAFGYMPDRYGDHDRSLTTVTFADGTQTFVVSGRISSDNPWEVGHAVDDGIDLRRSHTVVYEYDGNDTIVERIATGEENVHTGENGKPETLLYWVRRSLGTSVGREDLSTPEEK